MLNNHLNNWLNKYNIHISQLSETKLTDKN